MECRFNRSHHYSKQNNNILPVILYLTLPSVNYKNEWNDSNRTMKRQKQKQRDFQRMKQFNEHKTVCSVFPFYSLENNEIQNMVTRPVPVKIQQRTSKAEKTHVCKIQEEYEKVLCENSKLQSELKGIQNELKSLKTEYSNLQSKFRHEQYLHEETETEYLAFKRHTENATKQQERHNDNINKHNLREISNLKGTIQQLNMELSECKSKTTTSSANKTSTTKQTGAHHGGSLNMPSSQKINQRKSPTASGCRKCGSTTPHQPRQCPAKNFVCVKCSKKGHHTINCILICTACAGTKGISCKSPADCVAKNMNCAYCNVQGHLDCVCLKKRMDELGY